MAGEKSMKKDELAATELKADPITKSAEHDLTSRKDETPSDSTASMAISGDAASGMKGETDQESVGVHGAHNLPTVYYSYYYPGYIQHPVSYGSEAMPCYSWDSTYHADARNGNLAGIGNNVKYGRSTAFAKSNGLNSIKTNGSITNKFSKSSYIQPTKPLSKAPQLGSNLSAGFLKGYHPLGNFFAFSNQKQGIFPHNSVVNYKTNGRTWNGNDRYKSRDKFSRNGGFEMSAELTRGPRSQNKSASLDSSVRKEDLGLSVHRDQYNLPDFQIEHENAKFYVIKSYNEDDIHQCIKYDVWASTPNGNKKLDAAFHEAEAKADENATRCPIFLFFWVNGSGQFVGLAEMMGKVDFNKDMDFWQLDKWNGFFSSEVACEKDIPNFHLWYIILENNDNKPVTHSGDTQEIGLKQGLEMVKIFKSYTAKTSLLDDFYFYENREKSNQGKKSSKPATMQREIFQDDGFTISSFFFCSVHLQLWTYICLHRVHLFYLKVIVMKLF